MAKNRRQEEAPKGSPAWMATFSDLMNLLLCFFVLLFSMSSVDEAKYEELVVSLSNSFSIFDGGGSAIGEGVLISSGVSQLNELDDYMNDMGSASESEATEDGDPMKEWCMDFVWYLWCGPKSPVFGKDKMATFESYFVADKATHKERIPYDLR